MKSTHTFWFLIGFLALAGVVVAGGAWLLSCGSKAISKRDNE